LCIIAVFLCSVCFIILPSPYVTEKPGPSTDVLSEANGKPIIDYQQDSEDSNKYGGSILLLSVAVYGGPLSYSTSLSKLPDLVSDSADLKPQEMIYKPRNNDSATVEEAKKESDAQMKQSQNSAVVAAAELLKARGIDLPGDSVKIMIEDLGGPSAGLAFTLGILQKAGNLNLTNGRVVAATGTVDDAGNVGKIGGLKEKAQAAVQSGVDILLVPEGNYPEVSAQDQAVLKVVPVKTVDDAVNALLN
jgi:PDZ domain-containing protein